VEGKVRQILYCSPLSGASAGAFAKGRGLVK